jgi:peptidoglycan-N-acetylglucosamine deacetylase
MRRAAASAQGQAAPTKSAKLNGWKLMRVLPVCAFALATSLVANFAWAEDVTTEGAAPAACPSNPNVLGVSRVVEIDTTGGPGFGSQQFKTYDFLQPGEVVLTFDDGPWPGNTPAVLQALQAQCTKALFFPIGEHAMWHPGLLRQVAADGHTIGSHTWSHADLSKLTLEQAEDEIEKGLSGIRAALREPEAPFFRFPGLRYAPDQFAYLGTRNIGVFSDDFDSLDFKIHKPDQVIASVMTKLKKAGKGIVLMHDFQHATSVALPELLVQLKAGGYRIVQVKAKAPAVTLAQYDEQVSKELGGATAAAPPMASVVRTVGDSTFNDRFSAAAAGLTRMGK